MNDIPVYRYYHGNHVNVDFGKHNVAFYDKKKRSISPPALSNLQMTQVYAKVSFLVSFS